MTSGVKTILFPARDLARAKAFFSALLGVAPTTDAPYYVGFDAADQQIGLVPNGHAQGMTGAVPYWHVDDIAAAVEQLVAVGGTVQQPAKDVGGGRLVGTVTDPDGNVVGLIQDR